MRLSSTSFGLWSIVLMLVLVCIGFCNDAEARHKTRHRHSAKAASSGCVNGSCSARVSAKAKTKTMGPQVAKPAAKAGMAEPTPVQN